MPIPSLRRLILVFLFAGGASFVFAAADEFLSEVPAGWTATTIAGCEDASVFSAGRMPDRPDFDFDAYDLSTTAGARVQGESLRWHVQPTANGSREARLMWAGTLHDPFDGIAFWVKNPNGHHLTLRLELVDADCVRYTSPGVDLADELGWRQIVLPRQALIPRVGQDPNSGIDPPVMALSLVIEPLEPARPQTVYVDEIRALRAPPRTVEVANLQAPTALGPGESISVRATLHGALPNDQISACLLSTDGGRLASGPIQVGANDDPDVSTAAALRIPIWLPPGRYQIALTSPLVSLQGAAPLSVAVAGPTTADSAASLDASARPPRITVGDRPLAPIIHELQGDPASSLPTDAALIAIPATTDCHPYAWAADVVTADGQFDAAVLDARVSAALTASPKARIILQVFLASSPEWNTGHPDDLQRFDGGTLAPATVFGRSRIAPDLVSAPWRRDAEDRLRKLVQHVRGAPWGDRVIGYELLAGDLGAWRPLGSAQGLGDQATPLRERAFRAWLMDRYPNVQDFRDAWGAQRRGISTAVGAGPVGFEAVRIPPPLMDGSEPSLYDPASDRPMIDWLQFQAETQAQLVLDMAETVHDAAGAGKLVGACYGHMLSQSLEAAWRWSHLAITRLLTDQRVDFLTGPLWTAAAPPIPSFAADSARRAGKLYLERATPDHADRNAASALVSGAGLLAAEPAFAELGGLAAQVATDRQPEAQVPAMIVLDDVSARYLSREGGLPRALLGAQLSLAARSGLPFSVCMIGDVLSGRAPRAQLYLFPDLLTITPEDGNRIGREVARDGAMLVWVYAPGAVAPDLITGRTMQYLTGLKLSLFGASGPLKVRVESGGSLPGSGIDAPLTYGLASGSPRFFCADEAAEWLGTLVDSRAATGDAEDRLSFCGLALRRFPQCTSVFSAAPMVPPQVLRGLAGRARLDPWADSRAGAWFGPGIVVIEGAAGGPRQLSFPWAATVTNLRTGEMVATDRLSVQVGPAAGQLGIYAIDPR